ncbi:MAG: DegV family protein [Clostridia bacterium]|nr:DegV family protein [Clostridia bacterium]
MIRLFYDSDCELDYNLAKQYGIESEEHLIKMPYIIKNEQHLCELITEESSKTFFEEVKAGNMPSTAALNAQEYINKLEPYFANGDEMLYVAFSSAMSGTFNNLNMALKELEPKYPKAKFVRYDTKAISMSAGLAVVIAKQLIDQGKTMEEVVAGLDEVVPYINCSIIADDLMYLKRGGRLTALKALLGTMLQLKPIIKLTSGGTLIPTTNVAGRNKALMTVMKETAEQVKDIDKYPIIIMNGDCDQDTERVHQKLSSMIPGATILPMFVGPIIGSHCGPGTLAIVYVGQGRPAPIND